ncbi:G2/M phase-specific E3 ubiquitin-protein ligase-like [Rhinichthys klamathensis goyatoka]|uniref:G2/M phase-specific E3 ubiquitin-protein ligase-like n=1 Tax=Rhinichthys klamathensis goyatoka TaxID=3034132 RepID=UPI0024B4FB4E|nr:G2/M phase-specific E3 ubiquitin-protein ligase-like [Rhinichthys klamathensis goyatoka]
MENLKQGALFVGPDEAKFLNFNSRSMQNDDYFFAGVAIALSVVHGGPGPQFISPSLFRALTTNPEGTVIAIEEVTDPMLCINLQRLASGDYDAFTNIESIIVMAGTFAVIKDHQTARKVALDTAHWYCLGRNQSAFERFKEGLKTLGVLEAMQENPTSFSAVMCHQPQQFTYCSFSSLMEPELNLPGSSKRNTENLVLSFWRTLLIEIEDEPSELQDSDIFFTTGLKTMPPLGLRPHPSIHFLHTVEENEMLSLLPKANICANSISLPTCESEDDISDKESDVSSIDLVAEDMFLDGGDVTLDK